MKIKQLLLLIIFLVQKNNAMQDVQSQLFILADVAAQHSFAEVQHSSARKRKGQKLSSNSKRVANKQVAIILYFNTDYEQTVNRTMYLLAQQHKISRAALFRLFVFGDTDFVLNKKKSELINENQLAMRVSQAQINFFNKDDCRSRRSLEIACRIYATVLGTAAINNKKIEELTLSEIIQIIHDNSALLLKESAGKC